MILLVSAARRISSSLRHFLTAWFSKKLSTSLVLALVKSSRCSAVSLVSCTSALFIFLVRKRTGFRSKAFLWRFVSTWRSKLMLKASSVSWRAEKTSNSCSSWAASCAQVVRPTSGHSCWLWCAWRQGLQDVALQVVLEPVILVHTPFWHRSHSHWLEHPQLVSPWKGMDGQVQVTVGSLHFQIQGAVQDQERQVQVATIDGSFSSRVEKELSCPKCGSQGWRWCHQEMVVEEEVQIHLHQGSHPHVHKLSSGDQVRESFHFWNIFTLMNIMMKSFHRCHWSNTMDAAFEKLSLEKDPNNVPSRIIFVLVWKKLGEDHSTSAYPARSASALHSTTRSFVGITGQNLSPNFHQVGNLELPVATSSARCLVGSAKYPLVRAKTSYKLCGVECWSS